MRRAFSLSSIYIVNVSPWSFYSGIILRSNHAFFTWLYHRRPWLKGCLNVWSALGKKVLVACPLCACFQCARLHLLLRPSHHLLHRLVNLSVQSTCFYTLGLWQGKALIVYCRMTFNLSRWPQARGHKWGPQVMDAIIAHPGTNSRRRSLTVPLSECMK